MTPTQAAMQLRDAFLRELEAHTLTYKVIGFPHENPMWFTLAAVHDDRVAFIHSGSPSLTIELTIDVDQHRALINSWEEAADYFRSLKYDHLKANHPTVYAELPRLHPRHVPLTA